MRIAIAVRVGLARLIHLRACASAARPPLAARTLILAVLCLAIVSCTASSRDASPVPTLYFLTQQPASQAPVSTTFAVPTAASLVLPPVVAVPSTQLPTQPPAVQTPRPTPTIACGDNLTFVADLTVPDGSYIARLSDVDKRWQVRNTGTCNWDERYRLVLIAGPELGQPKEQALYPARAGAEALIRLVLKAPDTPGVYTSAWQAFNPAGEPFGEVIYVEFQVN